MHHTVERMLCPVFSRFEKAQLWRYLGTKI